MRGVVTPSGWTIPEAVEHLVDEEVLRPWLDLRNRINEIEREAIRSHGPLGPAYVVGPGGYSSDHPALSNAFFALVGEKMGLEPPVRSQFLERLQNCRVFARKGESTADLTEIPTTALPFDDDRQPGRLMLSYLEDLYMEDIRGKDTTTYFDVRIFPPGAPIAVSPNPSTPLKLGRPRGTGFDDSKPLAAMHKLVVSKGMRLTAAAVKVIESGKPPVEGGGTDEAKVRRLARKYNASYGSK